MNPDLDVDTGELRRAATRLSGTGAETTAAASATPSTPRTPRWQAVDAATLAAETARQQLAHLGADIAETAGRVTASAAAYEQADERAATRLRLTR